MENKVSIEPDCCFDDAPPMWDIYLRYRKDGTVWGHTAKVSDIKNEDLLVDIMGRAVRLMVRQVLNEAA